jgi:predicted RNA-binding protein Jag
MKSIMEEASSISKAIDQAWIRAGKPAEFTIKILEHPERNMFGLTVKSAKVAFFFDERKATVPVTTTHAAPAPEYKQRAPQPARYEDHRPRQEPQRTQQPPVRQPQPQARPQEQKPKAPIAEQQPQQPRAPRWNDEMVQSATEWLNEALKIMNKSDVSFTSSTSGNNITFQFSQSITGNQNKDRLLFSGFANLIMATLRNKYKKSFRFNKVILITT